MLNIIALVVLVSLPCSHGVVHARLSATTRLSAPSASVSENQVSKDSFSSLQSSLKGDQVLTYKTECNVEWSYYFQGTDWNCLCSTGVQ